MEIEKIESFFRLPLGCLTKIEEKDFKDQILRVLQKSYEDAIENQNTCTQLSHALTENSDLKMAVGALEKNLINAHSRESDLERKLSKTLDKLEHVTKELEHVQSTNLSIVSRTKELNLEIKEIKNTNLGLSTKITELFNELENKNAKLTLVSDELNNCYIKLNELNNINFGLKNDAHALNLKLELNDKNNLNNIELNKLINDNKLRLNDTISAHADKCFKLESELSSALIELKCKDKQLSLMAEESRVLKSFKSAIVLKFDHYNSRLNLIENHCEDNLSHVNARVNLIEKFYKTQYESNLEATKKLTKYLSLIEELKNKISNYEIEKNNLNEKIILINNEFKNKSVDYEQKIFCLEKHIELLKSNPINVSDYTIDKTIDDNTPTVLVNPSFVSINTSLSMRTGLTLTDIYSDYTNLKTELIKLTNDNNLAAKQLKKLINNNDSLSKQIEEITIERDNLVTCNCALTKKLNEARTEILSLNCQLKENNLIINKLNRNIESINKVKIDLSAQVQQLLLVTETCTAHDHNINPLNLSNSINLPLFNNINELQSVNIQLLEIIHDLEGELEFSKNLNLSNAQSQNPVDKSDEIKDIELKQVNKLLEVTAQQRDMFKILYCSISGQNIDACAITQNFDSVSPTEYEKLISENRVLTTTNESLTKEINTLRLDYGNDKTKFHESHMRTENIISDLNHRISELITKNDNLNNIINLNNDKFNELNILSNTLQDNLNEANKNKLKIIDELNDTKKLYRNLINENDSLKLLINNLTNENKILMAEKSNLKPLLDQMAEINIQLRKSEFIYKAGISTHAQDLENNINLLKTQLNNIINELQCEKNEILKELNEIKVNYENERENHRKTLEKLAKTEDNNNAHNKNHQKMYLNNENTINDEYQDIINNQNNKIDNLNAQIEQYKIICNSAEFKLAEMSENYNKLKSELITIQNKLNEERSQNSKTIYTLKNENTELVKKLDLITSKIDIDAKSNIIEELNAKINNLTQENNNISDLYSKSIVSHSESLKKLNEYKLCINDLENKLLESNEKICKLEQDLNDSNKNLVEKCREIETLSNIENKNNKNEEVSLLYTQINTLREQLNELNKSNSFNESNLLTNLGLNLNNSSFNNELSTNTTGNNDELWKLLEFTRNEKSLIQGRLEHSQAEIARLNTKCAQLYQTIKTLEFNLQGERELRLSQGKLDEIETYKTAIQSQEVLEKERANLMQKLKANESKVSELTNNLQNTQLQCENLTEQLANLQDNYEKKFASMDEMSKQLTLARQGLSRYKNLILQYKSQLSEAQKHEACVKELENCKETIESLKSKDNLNLTNLESLKTEIEKLKKHISVKNDENNRLENKNKILTEKLLQKMNVESDKPTQISNKSNTGKEAVLSSNRAFAMIGEAENDNQVSISGPTLRKKIPPNIPSKLQSVSFSKDKIEKTENQSLREQMTATEYFEKSDTRMGFEQSEKLNELEEGELIQPTQIVFCEKKAAQRTEIKAPSSAPQKSSNSNSSSSRFGLIRNILKKDDVIAPKSSIPSIEPPSVNRFKTILKSQVRKVESDPQITPVIPLPEPQPVSIDKTESPDIQIPESKIIESPKIIESSTSFDVNQIQEIDSNQEKVENIDTNALEAVVEESAVDNDVNMEDHGFPTLDFSSTYIPPFSVDISESLDRQESMDVDNQNVDVSEDLNQDTC